MYKQGDRNKFQDAMEDYNRCYSHYFRAYNNIDSLKEEIVRPDINDVCKRYLTTLRSASSDMGFKELIGRTPSKYEPTTFEDIVNYKHL